MDRKIRTTLLFLSALLFLIAAPIVVLYAVGYRFVPSDNPTIPVGVLFVESVPRGATMYVDGKIVGTTPEAVSGIREGQVHVRLEKEGYSSWEKTVQVQPTRTTEFRAVKLFAQDVAARSLAQDITLFSLSPNRRLLAVVKDNELQFLNEDGEEVFASLPIDSTPDQLLWSPDSTDILLRTGSTYQLVTAGAPTSTSITALQGARDVAWDTRLPGRLFGLLETGELVTYATSTDEVQGFAADVRLFAPTARHVVTVTAGNEIIWYTLQGANERTLVLDGIEEIQQIRTTPSGNVALEDENGAVTIVTHNGDVLDVAVGAGLVGWSPDGMMLLIRRDAGELAVYNVENKRTLHIPLQELKSIIRLSRPIREPQWFAGGTHIVFQVDDEIVLSEIDTRDHAVQVTIDTTNTGNAHTTVGEDGYWLLYEKVTGSVVNLVQRPLVLPADQ